MVVETRASALFIHIVMRCAFLLDEPTNDIMHNALIFSVAHN